MKRKLRACLIGTCALVLALASALADPLTQTADLAEEVRIPLNDRNDYVYSCHYPQVDAADPSAELINSFYQYLAEDAVGFEVPMNADYYRSQGVAQDVSVEITYSVTCNNDDFFSVLIRTRQDTFETFAGHTFSRKDIKPGSSVALPYLLGILKSEETDTWLQDRQTARADALVRQMVWDALQGMDDVDLYDDLEQETLEYFFFPEEDFYLDETGNPVFYLQPGLAEEGERLITIPISIEEILDEM